MPHHFSALLILLVLALCCACTDDQVESQTPSNSCDQPPCAEDLGQTPDLAPKVDMAPKQICEPGTITACDPENTPGLRRCSANGLAEESGRCPQDKQVCRQGACVDVSCIPGARLCSGQTPQVCNQAGATYEDAEACQLPDRCEEGFCLDRCGQARRNKSYIGCEYWAVELENHLLYDEPIKEENLPPFGVVLTNPSDQYDATITVFDDKGKVANAVAERFVGVDRTIPGIKFETVYSEIVDREGNLLTRIKGPLENIPLPRGALVTLLLPHRRIPFGESSIGNFGYKITTTQPAVAYQFNPFCCNYNTTNDASLLLPESALTKDYMFLGYAVFAGTPSRRFAEPYSATLTLVATQDDTEVAITLQKSKSPERPPGQMLYPWQEAVKSRITGPDESGTLRVTLDAFEVLNLGAKGAGPVEDLTGTRIRASKPVAAFSGHSCAFVPYTLGFCDHVESQLFPLETWGRIFLATPLKLRNPNASQDGTREATYWKFVASQDDTRILTGIDLQPKPGGVLQPADEGVSSCASKSDNPAEGVVRLSAGESCEVGTREAFAVQSNNPIAVGAFISGQDSVFPDAMPGQRAGDPAFFFLPPEEQYRDRYTILTPKTYFQNWVTVTMLQGFDLRLNGDVVNLADYDTEEIPSRGYIRVHIPLKEGPHRLEGSAPFGVVVYGYDDYVSYAYTGGLNLGKLSEVFD